MNRSAIIGLSLGVVLVPLLAILGAQTPKTYHVAVSGAGTVCSQGSPCKVEAALDQARRGDTIQFGEGDFEVGSDTKQHGVTFRGAPGHKTRLVKKSGTSGGQIIRVQHDDITLSGLVIDGRKRNDSGHGSVRVCSSKGLVVQYNRLINSGSSHLSLGGSCKNSDISNVKVVGNVFDGSGYVSNHGEAIYSGDYAGTGSTRNVEIIGNEISDFSENGIDLKPPSKDFVIKDNWIYNQVRRSTQASDEPNTGVIVAQGTGHEIVDNAFENLISGKAVFNLGSRSNIKVSNNAIKGVQKTDSLVRSRTGGSSSDTIVERNQFCDTNTVKVEASSGLVVRNNNGVDQPAVDCNPKIQDVKAKVARHQKVEPVEPDKPTEPLPLVVPDRITYGETGDNVVRFYVKTQDGSDTRMDEREYTDRSVRFFDQDGNPLTFSKEKRAKPQYEPGWSFYLDAGYPTDSGIRVEADTNWITQSAGIGTQVERFKKDIPPPGNLTEAEMTFAWNVPADLTNIVGYRLKWGQKSETYTEQQDVEGADTSETTVTVSDVSKDWYFAVYSRGGDGEESDPSNEVHVPAEPSPPEPPIPPEPEEPIVTLKEGQEALCETDVLLYGQRDGTGFRIRCTKEQQGR